MKIKRSFIFLIFTLILATSFNAFTAYAAKETVYLGGIPAGFSLSMRGAYVVGLCDVVGENEISSPSKDADIQVGDVILYIDGNEINGAKDIEDAVSDTEKRTIVLSRKGETVISEITPAKDLMGNYRLGVFVKDNVNGIGTVTFIRDGRFASLGHPVLDDDGYLLKIIGGELFPCNITGFVKGEKGRPGELRGTLLKKDSWGEIEKNTIKGVYGTVTNDKIYSGLRKISLGEAKMGSASIITTIDGNTPEEYGISIIKVDCANKDNKNYVIKITDEMLLKETGGIVQGMSGSPIVQDGKLVGAVTHVFINDPTRGFGISVDNMLNN